MTPAPLADIHVHGGIGRTFDADPDSAREIVAAHEAAGVPRMAASLVSAPEAVLGEQVAALAPLVRGGTLLGIHLEGPFLAPARRGAHDLAALLPPDPGLVETLVELAGGPGAIAMWTLAPELPGANEAIDAMLRCGIRPAFGHTQASAAQLSEAMVRVTERGGHEAIVTHLFNGMPPMHHRDPGPVAAALAAAGRGEAIVELIADGVHVAPEAVAMVFDTVGPGQVALVSDAMAAALLGDGTYRLGSQDVVVRDGVARLSESGEIAGSTTVLSGAVVWASEVAGVEPAAAIEAASRTPMRALLG